MIENLIEASIRNRYLVMLVAVALTVLSIYAVLHTPMDAIPDLSENQVIVFTDWMGRSPREIEDQVTYPLSLKLQGLAGVKAVRSASEFNFSMITIIFEDNIDFYFARERVLERLTLASTFLPQGVVPYLAPDSTALGQIFWYTLDGGDLDPGRRWALQRFYVGPELNAVPGVAEVATVGGMPFEYQIDLDPAALRAYGVTVGQLYDAVSRANMSVGGGVVQKNNAEYLVRGVGWIESTDDIENIVLKEVNGTPVSVKNVARVQIGPQFRRSVYEKDGNEAVGGAVIMRYGENPLAVTERVKAKIQDLQAGLPAGVHIVPAYDRTRLIHGAIHTLTEVMWHEIVIASICVLLILVHLRSVFVICITLPLSVLFSFLMMWLLRRLGIIDIQANIMSLAGITISIGILVDQAIVMVENATHTLKEKFGDQPVTGDTTEVVVRACRLVGRPIFFSVLIVLVSFIPVFALSGRDGKYFHPMAFTKSLAMVGVALISVTLVPALIPGFIRGKLKREEDNWIVRSFINIYKPLLTWALPRRNLVMWSFAALLILAIGMFPLQAVFGLGASYHYWKLFFFIVLGVTITLTVMFTHGVLEQLASFVSLMVLGMIAFHFPKIGVIYMPALYEMTVMDMPITVPRASVTETADDLKARDALLRLFPEIESVIGKGGRADTPTDPAPIDMVETFVNFRPREHWPKRALRFADAARQVRAILTLLEERGYVQPAAADERDALINDATMLALARFDDTLRALAAERYRAFEKELQPLLVGFVIADTVRRLEAGGILHWPADVNGQAEMDRLTAALVPQHGRWLSKSPALEDVTAICQEVARHLTTLRALKDADGKDLDAADALALREGLAAQGWRLTGELLGTKPESFASLVFAATEKQRFLLWQEQVSHAINWELFDRGVETFTWSALAELAREAKNKGHLEAAAHGEATARFISAASKAEHGQEHDPGALSPFQDLRRELEKPFAAQVLFWRKTEGTKGDLQQELDTVLQVPGWSNIWTQPIQNRVDMLSTGVRTQVGVKVFGPDLATINRVCKQIEEALKPLDGARDVIAEPIMGKGYLEIIIDRQKAARYGVSVGDIQDTIEIALGGRIITQTVEGRDRFPVRVRYARDFREDEESVKQLLVSRGSMGSSNGMGGMASRERERPEMQQEDLSLRSNRPLHQVTSAHSANNIGPLQIPLVKLADIRIVEGPAMIKSENGRLRNYVTLNVRGDRDIVGFVEEAQRVVAEKVQLPEGVHIAWAGEFEHQLRAARTLRIVFPAVIVLIFLILYLTYKDLVDAGLMMLAVPEALAGGVFFQFLFPKIIHGWDAPPMEFSLAVWVGYIAAFGMATETGIIMLVYLREAIDRRGGLENIQSLEELKEAVIEGAVHRLRPKLLTEGTMILALAPMLWASGVGGEILSAMAVPVLGGILIADEVVDIFLPVRFFWVRRARWLKLQEEKAKANETVAESRTELAEARA